MLTPTLKPGLRIYAIGDIHGCASMLERMLELIDADLQLNPAESVLEVFLGDFVDRGPDSAAVLKRVAMPAAEGRTRVHLMGNHEHAMVAALEDYTMMPRWLAFGGEATLRSYGIEPREWAHDPQALQPIAQSIIPQDDLTFLARLKTSHQEGNVLFVHAGIRPGVPLGAQDRHDLLWIRDEFLDHPGPHPAFIVHGHTPVDQAEVHPYRVNVDTGAVYGGPLTALVLEGSALRFLSVPHGS